MNMNKEALFIYEEDGFCELKYTYGDLCKLFVENNQLKEQIQELRADYGTLSQMERDFYKSVIDELRSWLEEEKVRLARECSQIYEDSLGKTRLVNEDIFNELNNVLSKLNELEGGKNDSKRDV